MTPVRDSHLCASEVLYPKPKPKPEPHLCASQVLYAPRDVSVVMRGARDEHANDSTPSSSPSPASSTSTDAGSSTLAPRCNELADKVRFADVGHPLATDVPGHCGGEVPARGYTLFVGVCVCCEGKWEGGVGG